MAEIGCRHNNISLLDNTSTLSTSSQSPSSRQNEEANNKCFFATIATHALHLLLKLPGTALRKKFALTSLLDKLGICSCMSFDSLIDTLVGRDQFYFSHLIASVVFEYVFMSIELGSAGGATGASSTSTTTTSAGLNSETTTNNNNSQANKRKSIFFPLLVDQSLVNVAESGSSSSSGVNAGASASSIEASYNKALLKRIADLLEPLDERALLVSKYLVHSLKHFTRFIRVNYLVYFYFLIFIFPRIFTKKFGLNKNQIFSLLFK